MQGLRRSLFLITLPLVTLGCLSSIDTAKGQIIPDKTLGAERSVVNSNADTDRINGGARRGAYLFHSFREFSVREGRAAFFSNPTGVENIFSRVTGEKFSNISGTLGVADGNANLFFMNPNGIFFGEKARLDMRGSFLASTANSLLFDGGLEFSATNPQAPPMLAINIPIGLRFREKPGRITNQSVADDVGLQVDSGKTLSLVGGDISLNRGRLTAQGGQVNLGGLARAGKVGVKSDGSLSFPDGVARGNVSLTNGAQVDVTAGGGGSVNIYAQNLELLAGSSLVAGIKSGLGIPGAQAGDIKIDATDTVSFDGVSNNYSSGVFSNVEKDGVGNAGGINITAKNLNLTNGAQLSASTYGKGNAGTIKINAADTVSFDGVGSNGRSSGTVSSVFAGATGDAGGIDISTKNLNLTNGAEIGAGTFGKGNAGTIKINAADTASFDGVGSNGRSSGTFSDVNNTGIGNAGGIDITTKNLNLTNGAQLTASTYGKGNAGTIKINAADTVSFDGVGSNGVLSGTVSSVFAGATGDAGGIDITTKNLNLTNGAQIGAGTFGKGNAGTIKINAADTVSFDGVSNNYSSGAFSSVEKDGVGNAGGVEITTKKLNFSNGAQLVADTFGKGNAGTVKINAADTVSFDGVGSNGRSSGAFSEVAKDTVGNAGGIDINTKNLNLTNGAQLNASTYGKGNAGTVKITDADTLFFDGVGSNGALSGIVSNVFAGAKGDAGGIDISTKNLNLTNGAQIAASTFGKGNAGTVKINATDTIKGDGISSNNYSSGALSTVEKDGVGNAGGVEITTKNLNLTNGAQLNASTFGKGNAGTVKIIDADTVSFDGVGSNGALSGIVSNVFAGAKGDAGGVEISTRNLNLTNGAQIGATSFGNGAAGNITAITKKDIRLDNQASIEANTVGGKGNITLKSRDVILRRNSNITTNARGSASGGNITINTDNLVALENSDIKAKAEESYGGRVSITAQGIFGTKFRQQETSKSDITASSELGPEFSGQVTLNLPNVDPSHGLVELPKNVVDPTEQIAQNPCQRGVGSKFIITGRGGLPPSPNEATSSDAVRVDLVEPAPVGGSGGAGEQRRSTSATLSGQEAGEKGKSSVTKSIVPAQGWIFDKNGEVMLTGYDPTSTGLQRPVNSDVCPAP